MAYLSHRTLYDNTVKTTAWGERKEREGGERGERREERGGIELHVEDQKLWWDVKIVRLS